MGTSQYALVARRVAPQNRGLIASPVQRVVESGRGDLAAIPLPRLDIVDCQSRARYAARGSGANQRQFAQVSQKAVLVDLEHGIFLQRRELSADTAH